MLDKIREQSRSPLTFVIFGILILVFVAYFGPGSEGCQGMATGVEARPFAARVNGEEISTQEFQSAYQSYYQAYARSSGGAFTPEMAEQLKLKDTVLDRLVERRLLVDLAHKHGLSVGDAEIKEVLKKIPAFQKDGAFDFETYRSVVELQVGTTPEKFEREMREDLLKDKMTAQIRQGAKAAEDEILSEFTRDNDRANLAFVRFSVPLYRLEAEPTDEEVTTFLASADGKKQIEEEYKKKSFRFKKPKRVRAQHILVKVPEDAAPDVVSTARAKLEAARKEIVGGKDFAGVAKELSEDPGSKEKGGDLGFFGPGTMAKPFEEAAMALEPGKLSDLVRTRFGLHLIKVNEVQAAEEKKLEEVQAELARDLVAGEKAKRVARSHAEEALAIAGPQKPLRDLFPPPEVKEPEPGEPQRAPPKTAAISEDTGLFAVGTEYVPRIGVSGELSRDVAALTTPGQVLPKVYEVSGSWVIAQLIDRKTPDLKEFETRKAEYRDRVLRKKEGALVESFNKKLRQEAKVETNPELFAGRPAEEAPDEG